MAQHTHEHAISLTDILSESLLTSSSIPYTLDLNTPSARTYIDRLVGLPLDALVFEPSSISSQSHAIDSELVNLCFREYPTFISVHKCSAAVRVAIDDFDQSLSQLLDSVPALEQSCREFSTITSGIQKGREKASLVQEHQDKLVDLLEIPQLMETCVRNGYYQEALELASHVQEMGRRHENVLIQDVAMEVDSMLQLMLSQLLALLREPVKLPTLVKTIGYLRRLDKLDEDQLCLVFLISRLHNFRAQLVGIEKDRDDPVRYVRKYVDIFREHVYDIISQFSAIFVQPSGRHTGMEQLISFARLCVNDLSQLIKSYVPRMSSDSASMSSILIQLGYCALSFARVGMDFSSLVGAPFEEVVISVYTQSISSASITLFTLLDDALKSAKPPGDILITPDHLTNVLVHPTRPVVEDPQSPPPVFAHFPPLAQFVNAHLSALNALRLLAPLDCHSSISHAQSAALTETTNRVLHFLRQSIAHAEIDTDRPRHARTPSSPRAHLLRRNTETQLTLEARATKRREAVAVCLAFAEAWSVAVEFISAGLQNGVFAEMGSKEAGGEEALRLIEEWIEINRPTEPRSNIISAVADVEEPPIQLEEETVVPHTPEPVIDSPTSAPPTLSESPSHALNGNDVVLDPDTGDHEQNGDIGEDREADGERTADVNGRSEHR